MSRNQMPPLRARDSRILHAMAAGLTIKEVAIIEESSSLRIENRLRKLRARYKARTTLELVAMAIALSWIPPAHRPEVVECSGRSPSEA